MTDESIIFLMANGQKLKLSHAVIQKMKEYRQDAYWKKEAGGILLGRHIIESKDIIVDSISTPLSGDKQTRFSFFRKAKRHQKLIDKVWHESNGTLNYLGEWHTHPESLPSPSNIDLINWKRKLKQDKFYGDYLYFIIVGIQEILVWEGCKSTDNINQLPKEL
ncbi:MAG TPA: hypothetical protein EYP59_03385 [Thiotrichaceae bacterium]|nr:hypothetical protein [Thiotrichaceae bacterium]